VRSSIKRTGVGACRLLCRKRSVAACSSPNGVRGYRDCEREFVAGVAALVPFGLADKQTNLLRGSFYGEVIGQAADAGFRAAEKIVINIYRLTGAKALEEW
jgi:hypothetical protein